MELRRGNCDQNERPAANISSDVFLDTGGELRSWGEGQPQRCSFGGEDKMDSKPKVYRTGKRCPYLGEKR